MSRKTEISNTDNTIDSRDVDRLIADLESELEDLETELEDSSGALIEAAEQNLKDWQDENAETLANLQDLSKSMADYGADLAINDDYFEDYARDYAESIGRTDRQDSWPYDCIDWEKAADALKSDYTAIDFDGQTFWVR